MKQWSRDSWLALGLFTLLLILTSLAVLQQTSRQAAPALGSFSTEPDGARALYLWLDRAGYRVRNNFEEAFELPPQAALLFILEPFPNITPAEWDMLDDWVENGGTLVLAGQEWGAMLAIRHFDFSISYLDFPIERLAAATPLLLAPPLAQPVPGRAIAVLTSARNDYTIHLAAAAGPVVVSFEQGQGRIILSSTPYPFTNAGLKEPGNPELVLNLTAASRRSGLIWFDEWHHGLQDDPGDRLGPGNWLRHTPAGHALLYTAAIIFLTLLLQGRRFGRPIPLAGSGLRRTPLEYVSAIANLSRRAGHRAAVLAHYHTTLKRSLGRRYRLDPALPDAEYLARLVLLDPTTDSAALSDLLARLRQARPAENELVKLAAEAAGWMKAEG